MSRFLSKGKSRKNKSRHFLILGASLGLVLAVTYAVADLADDILALINSQIMQVGPFPGSIAEELPENLTPARANAPAFEGGFSGTDLDTELDVNHENFIDVVLDQAKIDAPTGAFASPLYNAQPFSQQMLRFEELGAVALAVESEVVEGDPFPMPTNARTGPSPTELDHFLMQYKF